MNTRYQAPIAGRVLAFLLALPVANTSAEAPDALEMARQAAVERGGVGEPLTSEQGDLVPSAKVELTVALDPHQCMVAAAWIDAKDVDAELSVRTPGGLSLGDGERGQHARLRYCAGKGQERAKVRLRAAQKTRFGFGVWPLASPGQVARVVPPEKAEPDKDAGAAESEKSSAPQKDKPLFTLEQRLGQTVQKHIVDMQPMTPPREEDVGPADPREREVALDAGRCYAIVAAADAGLGELQLRLIDPSGTEVASGRAKDAEVLLGTQQPYCPGATANHTLLVQALQGSGRLVWQLYGAPDPALSSRFLVGGEGEGLVAKRLRSLRDQHAPRMGAAIAVQLGKLTTAEEAEARFNVRRGFCYEAAVAGMPSLRSLDITLLDQRGHTLAQALDQGSSAHVRACAPLPGVWTVRIRAFKGYGDYGLQVFSGR
jgi:hypothetical protein